MSIRATIIADSISPSGDRITTFETEFPRWILAELNTHRQISKNASSSRAIPVERVLEQVEHTPALPLVWGSNNAGMQSNGLLEGAVAMACEAVWKLAARSAAGFSRTLQLFGLHKQWANRLIENFTYVKHVSTATEWDNFFHLRRDAAAQPEIRELADRMYEALQASTPFQLEVGDWHVPYYGIGFWKAMDINEFDLDQALKISASCCAQVSYRRRDDSVEKALSIYERLMGSRAKHSSPFEHQASPMARPAFVQGRMPEGFPIEGWEEAVTHLDRDGRFWSGNFRGWIQQRQRIPGHVCKVYEPQAD